ncbi:MAG: asparaginase [Deltaproteobacteria bacterium]
MQKILVIFTGGTIGSRTSNKVIDVDESFSYYLLNEYHNSAYKRNVTFETIQLLNMLSENLIPIDWMLIVKTISELDFKKYDGIILTHGSDTLPFTSVALSYILNWIPIPLVLTASNFSLDNPKSNGLRNFINSVDFILDNKHSGIFVVYENSDGESIVHLGSRLNSAVYLVDKFYSTKGVNYGKMIDSKFHRNQNPLNPDINEITLPREKISLDNLSFSTNFKFIKPFPGLNYEYYKFSDTKPKAVLHSLYHSGTACTSEAEKNHYSLLEFIKYCKSNDIDVYILPLQDSNSNLYSSTVKIIAKGAIPLENISQEAAIVKLMLAYGMFSSKEQIIDFIKNKNLYFEFIV